MRAEVDNEAVAHGQELLVNEEGLATKDEGDVIVVFVDLEDGKKAYELLEEVLE